MQHWCPWCPKPHRVFCFLFFFGSHALNVERLGTTEKCIVLPVVSLQYIPLYPNRSTLGLAARAVSGASLLLFLFALAQCCFPLNKAFHVCWILVFQCVHSNRSATRKKLKNKKTKTNDDQPPLSGALPSNVSTSPGTQARVGCLLRVEQYFIFELASSPEDRIKRKRDDASSSCAILFIYCFSQFATVEHMPTDLGFDFR